MPLSVGDKLGPYEILGPLGAGGMGEVYKANKTEFSERFEREARAVAALNHPNICTLHDVGPNYLVMEEEKKGKPELRGLRGCGLSKANSVAIGRHDPLKIHKLCSMLTAFVFQVHPVIRVEDAVRDERKSSRAAMD